MATNYIVNCAGNVAIIPLIPLVDPAKIPKVKLQHTVNNDKVERSCYFIDTCDVESLLRLILEYKPVSEQLGINDWTTHADLFCECLGDIHRDRYGIARALNPDGADGFQTTIQTFLSRFIDDTALAK